MRAGCEEFSHYVCFWGLQTAGPNRPECKQLFPRNEHLQATLQRTLSVVLSC